MDDADFCFSFMSGDGLLRASEFPCGGVANSSSDTSWLDSDMWPSAEFCNEMESDSCNGKPDLDLANMTADDIAQRLFPSSSTAPEYSMDEVINVCLGPENLANEWLTAVRQNGLARQQMFSSETEYIEDQWTKSCAPIDSNFNSVVSEGLVNYCSSGPVVDRLTTDLHNMAKDHAWLSDSQRVQITDIRPQMPSDRAAIRIQPRKNDFPRHRLQRILPKQQELRQPQFSNRDVTVLPMVLPDHQALVAEPESKYINYMGVVTQPQVLSHHRLCLPAAPVKKTDELASFNEAASEHQDSTVMQNKSFGSPQGFALSQLENANQRQVVAWESTPVTQCDLSSFGGNRSEYHQLQSAGWSGDCFVELSRPQMPGNDAVQMIGHQQNSSPSHNENFKGQSSAASRDNTGLPLPSWHDCDGCLGQIGEQQELPLRHLDGEDHGLTFRSGVGCEQANILGEDNSSHPTQETQDFQQMRLSTTLEALSKRREGLPCAGRCEDRVARSSQETLEDSAELLVSPDNNISSQGHRISGMPEIRRLNTEALLKSCGLFEATALTGRLVKRQQEIQLASQQLKDEIEQFLAEMR